jgi:hypothetical protein
MNNYTFWIPIPAKGINAYDAWRNLRFIGETWYPESLQSPQPPPIFQNSDPIPAAEILGGSLSAGFGIDEGEDDAE